MRVLYPLLSILAVPVALLYLLARGLRDPRWLGHLGERFGACPPREPGGVLVHAASVGEVQAAAPLISVIRRRVGAERLLATTVTPTGRERLAALPDVTAAYLSLDSPGAVKRRLDRTKPAVLVVVETEIWPGLFAACRKRGIPVVVVNARLSERALQRYQRYQRLLQAGLDAVDLCLCQSREDADRYRTLGIPREHIVNLGNLKFDVPEPEALVEKPPERRVWVAGSVRKDEEGAVLDAWEACSDQPLLVLAPRHPERFDAVASEIERRGHELCRRSRGEQPTARTGVWLVDTLGELSAFYAIADIAFVGGSLVAVGGHNLLEPAAAGVPVLAGPHLDNTRTEADALTEAGGLVVVDDEVALAVEVDRLLHDTGERKRMGQAARSVVDENRGALERTLEALEPWL